MIPQNPEPGAKGYDAEAAAERAAIQAEGAGPIAFSWGRDKFDAYPAQHVVEDFAALAKFVCNRRAKVKGKAFFAAPFAANGDGRHHRCKDGAQPRRFLALDVDYIENSETLHALILQLQPYRHFAYTTASHTPEKPRVRVVLELSREVTRDEGVRVGRCLQRILESQVFVGHSWCNGWIKFDASVYQAEQPCFGLVTGSEIFPRDRKMRGVQLDVDRFLSMAPTIEATESGKDRAEHIADDDPFVRHLVEHGYLLDVATSAGKLAIRCPNEKAHSETTSPTSTVVLLPHFNGVDKAVIKCLHASCANVTQAEFKRLAGFSRASAEKRVRHDDPVEPASAEQVNVATDDFYAYMPMHNYIFVPTCELWPGSSVDGRVKPWPKTPVSNQDMRPSAWLDANRPIEQMTWQPGEKQIITGKVMHLAGWVPHAPSTVFNLYRPPAVIAGDASKAGRWLDHLRMVYPDDGDHIVRWLAHRVQRPGDKINHAVVLSGEQGIGKDTLLEPVKAGVGPWNFQEISPAQMLGRFNGWAKAVIVRVSEARDMGDFDRFAFYDHCKVYTAAPPDVLRVDEKNLREHYVANVMGVIITTNHTSDGLYLPADDRRHYVARSNLTKDDFTDDYWTKIWGWYEHGGVGHVVAYLRQFDLSGFNPKAPPSKTPAFWNMVATGEAPESGELRDIIDGMGNPAAFAMYQLISQARVMGLDGLADEFNERKNRRSIPHKLERVGYVPVRNPDAESGMYVVNGRRQAVYALRSLPFSEQARAARKLA